MSKMRTYSPSPELAQQPVDWASALQEHARWLRTVVRSRLGEPQAVDEVMQEVSLAAVAQQAPLTDRSRVSAWLYRLAVRQTLLYRRKQGRRHRHEDRYAQLAESTAEGRPAAENLDPLGWLVADERSRLVREALDDLPRIDRDLLWLKYTENWTYHDLARHLGLSDAAVESRLHRARTKLRASLARRRLLEESR
jgi:RNA polymerase sigma-70 factor (ECF subfamily)